MPRKGYAKRTVTAYLSQTEYERLEQLAESEGRTLAGMLRALIRDGYRTTNRRRTAARAISPTEQRAIEGLTSLGFGKTEAIALLNGTTGTPEERVQQALKRNGKGA